MSKGNIFMGYGRGKVGSLVLSRTGGEQIARAYNGHPANPQTPYQMVQRVCQKSAMAAYSLFRPISNHAFEGKQSAIANQSEFMRQNIEMLRYNCLESLETGDPADVLKSQSANYNTKQQSVGLLNPWIISDGSLAPVSCFFNSESPYHAVCEAVSPMSDGETIPTYAGVINGFGLKRGDQLTFIGVGASDVAGLPKTGAMISLQYARVILEPGSGDLTTPFLTAGGEVNSPNIRNEGTVTFVNYDHWQGFGVSMHGLSHAQNVIRFMGFAVIVSRMSSNGKWLRSRAELAQRTSGVTGLWNNYLGDAVLSYMTEANSSRYLDQAERENT